MLVAFRTDASAKIGTGHVARCLTLADALRRIGSDCVFISREHAGHMIELIRHRGYHVHCLPKPPTAHELEFDSIYEQWLGLEWEQDARETKRFLTALKVNWLVVDHYGLDHRWETAQRPDCGRIMVIDDLADRSHNCDLLLDQNYGSSEERYAALTPGECRHLHGPKFALLNPVYALRRANLLPRLGMITRVLIYFGGAETASGLTMAAFNAFTAPILKDIELEIIIGSSFKYESELAAAVASRGKAHIHSQLSDLSELMATCDLAIGGAGSTTWERCCLGLPSFVVSVADNQIPATRALLQHGMIEYLGHHTVVTSSLIYDTVRRFINNPKFLVDLGEKGKSLVDGLGVDRVTSQLLNVERS